MEHPGGWTKSPWPEITVALISGAVFVLAYFRTVANPFIINNDVRQQVYRMQQWQGPALFPPRSSIRARMRPFYVDRLNLWDLIYDYDARLDYSSTMTTNYIVVAVKADGRESSFSKRAARKTKH